MSSAPTEGVIHDIGFRHYDGPRLGRGWIFRSLLVETLRGVFGFGRPAKAKVMPWVLVGILTVPALVMAIMLSLAPLDLLGMPSYAEYPIGMSFILSLFVAGRAPYAVSRDLRDGVLPLYLSRPLKRGDYVLAKLGGLSLGMFFLILAPQTVILIGALLADRPAGTELGGWLRGVVVAALLAAILGAIGLAIAATTPRRGMGVAAIMTSLILVQGVAAALVSVVSSKGYDSLAGYLSLLNPFGIVDGVRFSLLGDSGSAGPGESVPTTPQGFGGGLACVATLVIVIGLCVAALMRRYRKVGAV